MLVYFCCLFSSLKIKVCIVHLHPCFDCIKLCAVLLHLSWAIFEKAFKILFDACMSLLVALTHKVDTREENSPATPAGIPTRYHSSERGIACTRKRKRINRLFALSAERLDKCYRHDRQPTKSPTPTDM